jgi:hypothetical protein
VVEAFPFHSTQDDQPILLDVEADIQGKAEQLPAERRSPNALAKPRGLIMKLANYGADAAAALDIGRA